MVSTAFFFSVDSVKILCIAISLLLLLLFLKDLVMKNLDLVKLSSKEVVVKVKVGQTPGEKAGTHSRDRDPISLCNYIM